MTLIFGGTLWKSWRLALLAPALLASPALAGETPFASPAAKAAHSSARLVAAGPAPAGPAFAGVYRAGVEIDLEPATITYWRQPGDAGSAPVFDFSRSENVASVEVLYPAPKHIEEAGSVAAGYDSRVMFPLRVTPRDAAAPVSLNLALDYAACGKICLPAKARLSLALPRSGVSPFAEAIAAAEALVPKKLGEAETKTLIAIERRGGKDGNAWTLRYLGAGHAADLFAEAPEPLFLDSKRGANDKSFDLTLVSSCCASGKKPEAGVTATVTILTEKGAIEAPVRLE